MLKCAARYRFGAVKDGGFTLVELIVAMAIFVPLMATIIGLFIFATNIFTRTNDRFFAKELAVVIVQRIENNVEYADTMTIAADKTAVSFDSSKKYMYLSDGSYCESSGVTESCRLPAGTDGSYGSFICKLEFTRQSDRTLGVYIEIDKNGANLFSTNTDIYSNNMLSSNIQGSSGTAVEYTTP